MTETAAGFFNLQRVQELLGISRNTIVSLINAGFVAPARGPRNEHRFSFQDLMILRTAYALREGKVPAKKIVRSLARLREALPDELPLTGLRLTAVDANVVVSDVQGQWEAETGQFLMDFEVRVAGGSVSYITPFGKGASTGRAIGEDPVESAMVLEETDAAAAEAMYRQTIEHDGRRLDAYVNLGAMLCESGRCEEAVAVFDAALARSVESALLHFNRAIALEDVDRDADAVASYEAALRLEPALADAHFNLGRLQDRLGKPQAALQHLSAYRRLQRYSVLRRFTRSRRTNAISSFGEGSGVAPVRRSSRRYESSSCAN